LKTKSIAGRAKGCFFGNPGSEFYNLAAIRVG
jgi:hypothetical protein